VAPTSAVLAAVAAVPGVSQVAPLAHGNDGEGASNGDPSTDGISALDGHASTDGDGAPEGLTCRLTDARAETPAVVRAVVGAGGLVLGVEAASRTLEDVYFEVMGRRPQVEGVTVGGDA
jgi:hypothetical protein